MLILKRILFYFLSFTGGIIMSFIGLGPIIICAFMGKVHSFHGRLYATIGKDGGGLELGCFFICGENCQTDHLRAHECGHGLQNIILGPFMPLIICIPSAIRYGYREIIGRKDKEKYYKLPEYDAIGFEGWASNLGHKYILTDRA